MIVQCPSCKTKFSIDSSKLRDTALLRFHCSRCNHFFDFASKVPKREDRVKPSEAKQLEMPLPVSDTSLRSIGSNELRTIGSEEDNMPLITADWPSSAQDRPLEADLGPALRVAERSAAVATSRTLSEFDLEGEESPPLVITKINNEEAESPVQTQTQLLDDQVDEPAVPLSARANQGVNRPVAVAPSEEAQLSASGGELLRFPAAVRSKQAHARSTKARSLQDSPKFSFRFDFADWRGLMVASSLPLVLMLFFCAWAVRFEGTPESIKTVLGFDPATTQRVPPPGVEVVGLKGNIVTLDSGIQVFELSGQVLNNSDVAIRDIHIEGELYKRDNVELTSVVVSTPNGLAYSSPLSSMGEEEIVESQKMPGLFHLLRPNEQLPFRLVFADTPISQLPEAPAWFSSRVYSARRVQL